MSARRIATTTLVLCASLARAHVVTVLPSTCAATIGLSIPAAGVTAAVAAAPPGELLRTTYDPEGDPARSRMQVCPADPADPQNRCGAIVPRPFTIGAVAGSLALPALFPFELASSGELRAARVPVTLTFGAASETVAVDLTSGLAGVGGALVTGAPIAASGDFGVAGTAVPAALPAPMGGAAVLVTIGCTLAPPPDLDQFALAPRIRHVRGRFTSRARRLAFVLETDAFVAAAFDTRPTQLHLAVAPALDVRMDGLVAGTRKRFTGTAADGTQVTTRPLRTKTGFAYRVRVRAAARPLVATTSTAALVADMGGMLARTQVTVHAAHGGTRATVRSP